ncbi:MAG TPA: histidine phosphatase family protein [Candidatus Binatia bacterium]|jgi:broad specificity phosphatase PhoE
MRVFLLRHGATDWNLARRCQGRTDLELNDVGLKQAEAAALDLSREKIAAVYSSDLKRALQTAGAVGRFHNLTAIVDESIRELDHGEIEGLTFAEIHATRPDFIRQWRETPADAVIPGGEGLIEVERRAWGGLCRIARRHRPEETIVVVSHNFPILAVLCRVTGTPLNQYRLFHVEPGAFVQLSYNAEDTWRVIAENGRLPLRQA